MSVAARHNDRVPIGEVLKTEVRRGLVNAVVARRHAVPGTVEEAIAPGRLDGRRGVDIAELAASRSQQRRPQVRQEVECAVLPDQRIELASLHAGYLHVAARRD